jgi:hypothetical protein
MWGLPGGWVERPLLGKPDPPGVAQTTLVYAEKVRPQFLSLRQFSQGHVFSGRTRWQLSPSCRGISNSSSGLPNPHNRSVILRNARFSPDLCTSPIDTVLETRSFSSYLSVHRKRGCSFHSARRKHPISKLSAAPTSNHSRIRLAFLRPAIRG